MTNQEDLVSVFIVKGSVVMKGVRDKVETFTVTRVVKENQTLLALRFTHRRGWGEKGV